MLLYFLLKYYFLPRFTLIFLKGTCVTWIKFHFWAPLICQSVCLSVLPSVSICASVHSVFRTFLSHPLRYWLEIWYMNLSWHNKDQRLLSCLTYFYLSYCPYRWKLLSLPVKLLNGFWWNLVGMKYLWSLTSVVVFRPDPPRGRSRAGQK